MLTASFRSLFAFSFAALVVPVCLITPRAARRTTDQEMAGHKVNAIYTLQDAFGRNESANTLFQDRQGRIWAGTDLGCATLSEGDVPGRKFLRVESGLASMGVRAIAQSGDGRLWFAAKGSLGALGLDHLTCFDGMRWEKLGRSDSPLKYAWAASLRTIFPGADGKVWLAQFTPEFPEDGQVAVQQDGLWFLRNRFEDDLFAYSDGKWGRSLRLSALSHSRKSVLTQAGLEDTEGVLWLAGTSGVANVELAKNRATIMDPLQGVASPAPQAVSLGHGTHPNCIYEDRRGRIWIGASNGWVCWYDKARGSWERRNLLEFAPEIPESEREFYRLLGGDILFINAIYQDRDGRMMFGTSRGLFVMNATSEKPAVYTEANSALSSRYVQCIMEDKDGRIWIGGQGAIVLEP
jgi:ligand-binding sensor domain-containing protein